MKIRKIIFKLFFSKSEQTAIINALWRRQNDFSTNIVDGDLQIRNLSASIAKELMS